ncbi:MAG TPA: hypothetical protein V6D11_33250 [Waterburya sp.]
MLKVLTFPAGSPSEYSFSSFNLPDATQTATPTGNGDAAPSKTASLTLC